MIVARLSIALFYNLAQHCIHCSGNMELICTMLGMFTAMSPRGLYVILRQVYFLSFTIMFFSSRIIIATRIITVKVNSAMENRASPSLKELFMLQKVRVNYDHLRKPPTDNWQCSIKSNYLPRKWRCSRCCWKIRHCKLHGLYRFVLTEDCLMKYDLLKTLIIFFRKQGLFAVLLVLVVHMDAL